MLVVDGNAAKDFIEDNDETQEWDLTRRANQDLEMPIYYVGLDIVKPHVQGVPENLTHFVFGLLCFVYSCYGPATLFILKVT